METPASSVDNVHTNVMENKFTMFYAQVVRDILHKMAQRCCYGCRVEHLSQTKHSCIQLLPEQKLELYFSDAIGELNHKEIMERWCKIVDSMDAQTFELLDVYVHGNVWRSILFQTVHNLIYLEK